MVRERDPAGTDRRAVRARRERNAELFRLYAGMKAAMDEVCSGYTEAELELLAGGFLRRTAESASRVTKRLATRAAGH